MNCADRESSFTANMGRRGVTWPVLVGLCLLLVAGCMYRSPGALNEPDMSPPTDEQAKLTEDLKSDVIALSHGIGSRNAALTIKNVLRAERWITGRLEALGLVPKRIAVEMGGAVVSNLEVTFPGNSLVDEVIVLGAHYDTEIGSPGANDNASGVALLLATADALRKSRLDRTIRIVFFVNEENPFSFGLQMGSRVYADQAEKRRDDIVAMVAVDSVGYFSNEPGSQRYPIFALGLPSRGNFVAFGSNKQNIPLLDAITKKFQENSTFPSIGAASDAKHMARGDHAPFWWRGYPAILMTDTSEYRDPNYHLPSDVFSNLNYPQMARLTEGFIRTVEKLGNRSTELLR